MFMSNDNRRIANYDGVGTYTGTGSIHLIGTEFTSTYADSTYTEEWIHIDGPSDIVVTGMETFTTTRTGNLTEYAKVYNHHYYPILANRFHGSVPWATLFVLCGMLLGVLLGHAVITTWQRQTSARLK